MKIYHQWFTNLRESAAGIRVEHANSNHVKKDLKQNIVLLLDRFFAYFSRSYQMQRTQLVHQLVVRLANQKGDRLSVNKTNQLFQSQNPTPSVTLTPLSKSVSSNFIEENPPLPLTSLTVAENGVNQYQVGGVAACTPLACQFLASKLPATPKMIADLIQQNTFKDEFFAETDACAARFELKTVQNPWEDQRDWSPSMQVSLEIEGETGIRAAVNTLFDSSYIRGAIITGNGITIGMRKKENKVEFFDSHGDANLTSQGNAAYVKIFELDQRQQAADFLAKRFPPIGFLDALEILPIS